MKHRSCHPSLFFIAPPLMLGFILLFGTLVMLLWNHVLAVVVPVKTVTFLQALGLLLLARILVGGFPGGGKRRPGRRWRDHCEDERWAKLSPEERIRLRDEMKHRFRDWPDAPSCGGDAHPTEQPPGTPGMK